MANLSNKFNKGIVIVLLYTVSVASSESTDMSRQFSQSNGKFATKFYKTVVDSAPSENVIISPFSVQIGGAFLHSGASGQTAEEISKGLELFSNERNLIGNAFKNAIEEHTKDYLRVANKLYLAKNIKIDPQFHNLAVNNFLSEEENVDFAKNEETTGIINNWVQNITNNKIKNFFEKDALAKDTVMALVNAIYFKGHWEITFEDTKKDKFWINENLSKEVDMMSVVEYFKIGNIKELDATVLQMNYLNTDISMLIILPNKLQGLQDTEQNLFQVDLVQLQNRLNEGYVSLFLPRFKIEFTSQLNEDLTKMGMEKMFTNEADFSNLVADTKLKVDKAVHKAFIAVNEQGTEAGAATGYTLKFYSIPDTFKVDHPFMFAIVSKSAVLFLGRYVA